VPLRDGVWTRGTSNTNARGSAVSRRARRRWIEAEHAVEGVLTCTLCGVPLLTDARAAELGATEERFEVDRIVPGALGGRYVRGNVRPACRPCNNEAGQRVRCSVERIG
jgi:hypothetical protein